MFISRLYLTASFCILATLSSGASTFVLQAGAFQDEEEARVKAVEIESSGVSPVLVRPEELANKGLFYKVLVGDYKSRAMATEAKALLKEKGIHCYVRSAESYDSSVVRNAIEGTDLTPYFTDTKTLFDNSFTTLTEPQLSRRNEILAKETTSPAAIKNYAGFIDSLPDTNTAKSKEIISLGWYSFSGKSAYHGKAYDLSSATEMLREVANGKINGSTDDKLKAREMVAHSLHYYSRDYQSALKAYRQILTQCVEEGRGAQAAKARMEIAAASFELATSSGYNKEELEAAVARLWEDAISMQGEYFGNDDADSKRVRVYTFRIGLMLTEIIMLQKDLQRAAQLNESIISIYDGMTECAAELAEAYCHQTSIAYDQDNLDKAGKAANMVIELAETKRWRGWGDKDRDQLLKAFTFKYGILLKKRSSAEEKAALKQIMKRHFPDRTDIDLLGEGRANAKH